MQSIIKAVDGLKTYALGAALLLVGALELVKVDVVASVDQSTALETMAIGWGLIAGRSALSKLRPDQEGS